MKKIANKEAMSSTALFTRSWKVTGIKSAEKFFSALVELVPLPVQLCLEGTTIASDFRTLLASSPVAAPRQVPADTIWPKPTVSHVFATEQFIHELAGRHAAPEICDHFHVYNESHGLIQ